jgi:hypothetical protein
VVVTGDKISRVSAVTGAICDLKGLTLLPASSTRARI